MDRSLVSAVSGLRNNQTRMDVIGNNIANVNTTAFKASRANFTESFSQVLSGATRPGANTGGINSMAVGLGSQLSSIDTVFTQGNRETTGITTNLAVQGNSFFVVSNGNQNLFTRDGNFKWDSNGKLVAGNGAIVQGLMATNGVLGGALRSNRSDNSSCCHQQGFAWGQFQFRGSGNRRCKSKQSHSGRID